MKKLVNSIAGAFGYEIHKIAPPLSPALTDFLNAGEAGFEPDVEDAAVGPTTQDGIDAPRDAGQAAHSLTVEGWRFFAHSYAMVNQWQLLSLSRRKDVVLNLLDAPVFVPRWLKQRSVFEPQLEQTLRSIPAAGAAHSTDLMLRIFYPFDFSPSSSPQTAVFGTSEYQSIHKNQCTDYRVYERFRRGVPPPAEVRAVTPSQWSAEGFYKSGFRPEQVVVVPHGVDIATFHPMPGLRTPIRSQIGLADSDFVFLSIGAMTSNKGIDLLMLAFAEISRKFPHARLVLKGMNPPYDSKDHLLKILQKVPARDQQRVISRMKYFGNAFSNRKMALLYQAADVYVSPYRAEGFNMPVLEAAACGIPILCTRGGATDDFVTDDFARKIESAKLSKRIDDEEFVRLKPDVGHLIALMTCAIEDESWRRQAASTGPIHVRANYTWDLVVDTLVRKLWN